jgi:protein gp37
MEMDGVFMPTKIEWAHETWNPITGCTPISEGCQNCYAKRMAKRLAGRYGYPKDDPFQVTFHPDRLNEPFKWRKPRMVFVCSMGDLFHKDVPAGWIYDVFQVMEKCPQHTFMILTKRPARMEHMIMGVVTGMGIEHRKHIWLGVTAENQQRADERTPILLQITAAVRFISVEPMLGPIALNWLQGDEMPTPDCFGRRRAINGFDGIDWVICGAETGPRKRSMKMSWAELLRNQCMFYGIPFFFKKNSYGGRDLAGKIWEEYPKTHSWSCGDRSIIT